MENFFRSECKYVLTPQEGARIHHLMEEHIEPDYYSQYTVHSLYLDTAAFDFTHQRDAFRIKVRMRCYDEHGAVYLETKKKYKKIIYKQREQIPGESSYTAVKNKEMQYILQKWELKPRMLLGYERTAWKDKTEKDVRITLDRHIVYRYEDASLMFNGNEKELMPDQWILEIKCQDRIPIWLTEILSEEKVYMRPFSKYETAVKEVINHA